MAHYSANTQKEKFWKRSPKQFGTTCQVPVSFFKNLSTLINILVFLHPASHIEDIQLMHCTLYTTVQVLNDYVLEGKATVVAVVWYL